jgi:site-specific recombinase XerD
LAPASPPSKGLRKPARRTFSTLADEFEAVAMEARPRKKTTVESYRQTIATDLRPWFGTCDVERLSRSPEEFERYAVAKMRDGLSPKTLRNHLVLLSLMFKTARRWRWVSENPLELVEKPAASAFLSPGQRFSVARGR